MNQVAEASQFANGRSEKRDTAWTTADEIEFLTNICGFMESKAFVKAGSPSKARLIGRYIEAAEKREDWGQIDRDQVMDYAQKRMAFEQSILDQERNTRGLR